MAEALAAAAAISSVLQILEFSGKVAMLAYELVNSSHDALHKNIETAELAEDYRTLTTSAFGSIEKSSVVSKQEAIVLKLGKKCHTEAGTLISLLQGLKIDAGSHMTRRIWQSLRRAAKTVRKRNDITEKRRTLQELNGQLATALLCVMKARQAEHIAISQEALRMLKDIVSRRKFPRTKANEIAGIEYEEELQILDMLSYPELPQRRHAIPSAFASTYEWAFDSSTTDLTSWLSHGSETYWISGKAGSGKSTLMKFLGSHWKTRELLEHWCGDRPLIFAEFYFWYLGSVLQKSVEGLLRGVLLQILETDLSLVRVAFPQLDVRKRTITPIWEESNLMDALRRIALDNISTLQSEAETERPRFCFFIDGLDELSGDHDGLISLLRVLEQDLYIKLCVSSRPWNEFRTAYAGIKPSLRLQDLTGTDIKTYVRGALRPIQKSGRLASVFTLYHPPGEDDNALHEEILSEIVERAEGCFLWVHLAVASVLRGHREYDSTAILLERVRKLPSDLERFFLVILSRVDDVYSEYTAQVLTLAKLSASQVYGPDETENMPALSSFFNTWLISQLPRGLQDFETIYTIPWRSFSKDDVKSMATATEHFLSACCKDLLWLQRDLSSRSQRQLCSWDKTDDSDDSFHPDQRWQDTYRVQFLHRSVYEFLCGHDIEHSLQQRTPAHFKNGNIDHLLNLAQAKFLATWEPSSKVRDNCTKAMLRSVNKNWAGKSPDFFENLYSSALTSYVNRFGTDAGMMFRKDLIGEGSDRLLECLAASQLQSFFQRDILNVLIASERNAYECVSRLLTAALGFSTTMGIALSSINPKFIDKLLAFGASSTYRRERCSRTLWQLFMAQWYLEQATCRELGEADQNSRIWNVAVPLISGGADLAACFGVCECRLCVKYGGVDVSMSVSSILFKLCPQDRKEQLDKLSRAWVSSAELCI